MNGFKIDEEAETGEDGDHASDEKGREHADGYTALQTERADKRPATAGNHETELFTREIQSKM